MTLVAAEWNYGADSMTRAKCPGGACRRNKGLPSSPGAMKPVIANRLAATMDRIDDSICRRDELADEPMTESTKWLAIMRILPSDALARITA